MASCTAEQLLALIAEELGIPESELTPESSLELLTEDSLERVSLLQAIEAEYGVEFPEEDAQNFRSVQDVLDYLEAQ